MDKIWAWLLAGKEYVLDAYWLIKNVRKIRSSAEAGFPRKFACECPNCHTLMKLESGHRNGELHWFCLSCRRSIWLNASDHKTS